MSDLGKMTSEFLERVTVRRAEISALVQQLSAEDRDLEIAQRVARKLHDEATVEALVAPNIRSAEGDSKIVIVPKAPAPDAGEVSLKHAAALMPVTDKQAKVFLAVAAASKKSSKGQAYSGAIRTMSGFSNVDDALTALIGKGYVAQRREGDAITYVPLASGAPRVMAGHGQTRWTDEEMATLVEALQACHDRGVEPNFTKLGDLLGRTALAVEQKARYEKWYPGEPRGTFAEQLRPHPDEEGGEPPRAVEVHLPPAAVGAEITIRNETDETVEVHQDQADRIDEAEEVDADDLSKAPREVLSIIFELFRPASSPGHSTAVREQDIAPLMELDAGRLPFVLTRLSELKLITIIEGGIVPTKAGERVAMQIAADEAA